jgi:hypothetical protein
MKLGREEIHVARISVGNLLGKRPIFKTDREIGG